MLARTLVLLGLGSVLACGPTELAFEPTTLPQSGGELRIVGPVDAAGGIVVLIDGVAAQTVVRESERVIRVRVPVLPRAGTVDVELHAGDGTQLIEHDALVISTPHVQVAP